MDERPGPGARRGELAEGLERLRRQRLRAGRVVEEARGGGGGGRKERLSRREAVGGGGGRLQSLRRARGWGI